MMVQLGHHDVPVLHLLFSGNFDGTRERRQILEQIMGDWAAEGVRGTYLKKQNKTKQDSYRSAVMLCVKMNEECI